MPTPEQQENTPDVQGCSKQLGCAITRNCQAVGLASLGWRAAKYFGWAARRLCNGPLDLAAGGDGPERLAERTADARILCYRRHLSRCAAKELLIGRVSTE